VFEDLGARWELGDATAERGIAKRELGRLDEAETLFERLLGLRNDLGLLSEEYDVEAGRLVGNFPQAFSHLALIEAAGRIILAERVEEIS